MKISASTHIGHLRRINQDQFLTIEKQGFHLCVVCDGMGGANAGEVASATACAALKASFENNPPQQDNLSSLSAWLKEQIQSANLAVYNLSMANANYHGMGTTLVAALFSKNHALIANIGDSRAYLLNERSQLIQISEDHSLVNQWIKAGKMTVEEAKSHPQRSVLTNVLGVNHPVSMDLFELDIPYSDVLICSDGLHGMLEDEAIEAILNRNLSTQHKVDALIQAALDKGGLDNVTVVLAHRGSLK